MLPVSPSVTRIRRVWRSLAGDGGPWRLALGTVFSFEAALVLFMFAGIYKADPRFAWIPIDLTLLFFLVSLVCGFWILLRQGVPLGSERLLLVLVFGGLVAYAVLSMLWTPSLIYVETKLPYFAFLSFWALTACALIVAGDPVRYRRFFRVMLLFSLWIAVESFLSFLRALHSGTTLSFVLALSSNYLGLGRVIGPGLLVVLAYALYITRVLWARLALGLVSLCYLGLLLVIGGRTPFAAAMLGVVVLLVPLIRLGGGPRRVLWQAGIAAALLCAVLLLALTSHRMSISMPYTLARFGALQGNPRYQAYVDTMQYVDQGPFFGQGIASWPVVLGLGDARMYPHNVFLEVWFELGAFGLALLCTALAIGLWQVGSIRLLRASPPSLLALALFANAFVNASTAGDIHENRFLFATLGLLMLGATERYRVVRSSVRRGLAPASRAL